MSSSPTDESRASGFHRLSIGHLVMGLALLGLAGIWALYQGDVVSGDDLHWLLPIPWVGAGLVGLVATAVTGSRRHGTRATGWVGFTDPHGETRTETRTETGPETGPETTPESEEQP